MSPLVLALAGTDHHPFDRMVQWVDAAAVRHRTVRFVVQHGATRPPTVAVGHDYLPRALLEDLLAQALVVVCHGGPGLITEAREAGHVPLCMPRDPRLGEHVDGHQQRFAALVGDAGVVRTVTARGAFDEQLDRALLVTHGTGRTLTTSPARDAARAQVAADLDRLMTSARPHHLGRQRARPRV